MTLGILEVEDGLCSVDWEEIGFFFKDLIASRDDDGNPVADKNQYVTSLELHQLTLRCWRINRMGLVRWLEPINSPWVVSFTLLQIFYFPFKFSVFFFKFSFFCFYYISAKELLMKKAEEGRERTERRRWNLGASRRVHLLRK